MTQVATMTMSTGAGACSIARRARTAFTGWASAYASAHHLPMIIADHKAPTRRLERIV